MHLGLVGDRWSALAPTGVQVVLVLAVTEGPVADQVGPGLADLVGTALAEGEGLFGEGATGAAGGAVDHPVDGEDVHRPAGAALAGEVVADAVGPLT